MVNDEDMVYFAAITSILMASGLFAVAWYASHMLVGK